MNVREIVADWLKTHGYDGLVDDSECGCIVDDLMPCEEPGTRCVAGHRRPADPNTGMTFVIFEGPDPEKTTPKRKP